MEGSLYQRKETVVLIEAFHFDIQRANGDCMNSNLICEIANTTKGIDQQQAAKPLAVKTAINGEASKMNCRNRILRQPLGQLLGKICDRDASGQKGIVTGNDIGIVRHRHIRTGDVSSSVLACGG